MHDVAWGFRKKLGFPRLSDSESGLPDVLLGGEGPPYVDGEGHDVGDQGQEREREAGPAVQNAPPARDGDYRKTGAGSEP
jgi:hypothetical protein